MTNLGIDIDARGVLIPEADQTAVWLLGGLAQVLVPGEVTRDSFTVVQHTGKRGYTTPLHYHTIEDEVFIVLDGRLRMVSGGRELIAEAGTTMIIPKAVPHGFVAVSPDIRFLTIHSTPTPGERPQFDRFLAAEIPRAKALTLPTEDLGPEAGPDLDRLIELGGEYGYGYAGPAPTP
ncbi:cupin domain-containing protein [Saccharothrix sp. Mg75]|uniref:cupin domain-containing protein n=1 Tax=Saccharothrix sp. Mg75 TaxID=3445357 RepID=UPI003EE89EAA